MNNLSGLESEEIINCIINLQQKYQEAYRAGKQVEKGPTIVYQVFGKKTSELTDDERRAYKALLKRIRLRKQKGN